MLYGLIDDDHKRKNEDCWMKLADMGLRSAQYPCCQKFAGICLNKTLKISGPVGDRPEEDLVGKSPRSRDVSTSNILPFV